MNRFSTFLLALALTLGSTGLPDLSGSPADGSDA